ncbi:Bromodomain-containing protein [Cynara cardunculus var. scolymus]|uniref:Bromodomain-containing protein n=1 Tax=Cynara cardunculus var. scolymus TaxID=59895 RepID=A0A118JWV2_CYNCS|nr:Bromodomain-containing protein [Cynara cardunculus var. scolymus]
MQHDVFLISGNAMHFNSSGTIFFRQAHAIDKLAKRVFHVLRTNPENFESEFSGSRRRSCRRSQDETNDLLSTYLCYTEGAQDGKRCGSVEVDPRSTYKPDLDLNNDKYSKSLIHLHQEKHSYQESLMHFVKDLGPTAQMVAKHKLQRLINYNNNNNNGIWFHSCVLNDIGIGKQDSEHSSALSSQVSSRLMGGNESSSRRNGNIRLMTEGGFRLDDQGFFKGKMKW